MHKLNEIGIIHSCYTAKFGVPRQPGLVKSAKAKLELLSPYNSPDAVRGLDAFSHIWILFLFHRSEQEQWKATVRPPRLGGNKRVGVFASRSNFRPNPIGLSVVALDNLIVKKGAVTLSIHGGDFLDGTPVLDIKPYIPYADSRPEATEGFAVGAPEPVNKVMFEKDVQLCCEKFENEARPNLSQLIADMLSYDPRPAYQDDSENERTYGMMVYDLNVKWKQTGSDVIVYEINEVSLA